jgi:hypothetical protein
MSHDFHTATTNMGFLSLVLLACVVLSACAPLPMTLTPPLKPVDYSPEKPAEAIHMISFADDSMSERRHWWEKRRTFITPPIDTLNDALLVSLRESRGFERVDRNQPSPESGYILEGRLLKLSTTEGFWAAMGFKPWVDATCMTEFVFKNAKTGEILLTETITSTGRGAGGYSSGGSGVTTSYNSSGNVSTGTYSGGSSYNSRPGYEASMSRAIGENVSTITGRVMGDLARRASIAATETDRVEQPTERTEAASAQPDPTDSQVVLPAVSSPPD